MNASADAQLASIRLISLSLVIQQVLGDPAAEVVDFSYQALSGGLELGSSVFRFAGQARSRGEVVPWCMILKTVKHQESDQEQGGIRYWQREALAYQSGLLADLPGGLAAPRCHAVDQRKDGSVWLWLEELHDEAGPAWSLEQYALAARHLGQFNGAYLAGKRPLPAVPWIAHNWLRQYVEHAASMVEFMRQNPDHAIVRSMFPGASLSQVLLLWEARGALLDLLERLPQTYCHQDAFRRNLFALQGRTAAVDWTYTGIAPAGAELAPLIAMMLTLGEVPEDKMATFDQDIFQAYLDGLQQAGWNGSVKQVRLGFVWTFLLRYVYGATIGELFKALLTGVGNDVFEKGLGQSQAELATTQLGMLNYYNARMMEGFKLLSLSSLGRIGLRAAGYLLKRK